jgi:peptidoglycan/xylan/chitin deacetylase (PgdA/CDA1 family)
VNSDRLSEEHERWWDILERLSLPPSELEALNGSMWTLDAGGRRDLVAAVLERTGVATSPRLTHRVMTADEIRRLAGRPGHAIGAHTVNHLALTTHPLETKRCEVLHDKSALEQTIGRRVTVFSYPYGDFDAELVSVVRDAGFLAAVTVNAGVVIPGTDLMLMPRHEVSAREHGRFAEWLERIFRK